MIWYAFEWLVTSIIAIMIAALLCAIATTIGFVARDLWDRIRQ